MRCVFAALPVLAASPLTIGSRGDEVRSIQQILRSKGYRVNVNGVYTKDTAQAVSQYQKDKKIQVSGKVGGWTYYLLTGNRSKLPPKGQSTRFNNGAISKYRHFSGGDAFGNRFGHRIGIKLCALCHEIPFRHMHRRRENASFQRFTDFTFFQYDST